MGLRTKVLLVAAVVATLSGCAAKVSCSGDSVNCGGVCVIPLVDNFNCGACGNVCGVGTICEQGSCVIPCPAGQIACDGACVDPRTDPTFCGASGDCAGAHAGTTCSAWLTCQAGACGCATSGQVSCDSACVDPRTSATHCGASGDCTGAHAGTVCAAGLTCQGGACACPISGQVSCGGACIDPRTDVTYCGATADCTGAHAGTTCAAGQTCQSGTCIQDCTPVPLDLDTPFAATQPPFPSHHGQQTPTALWASTTPPLPTNTTWQNLVLGTGDNRFDMVPYQVRAEPVWLAVGVATPTYDAATAIVPDVRQIRLGALEFAGVAPQKTVQSYDLLSVTLRYTKTAGTMTAPLVQGSPYVTVDFAGSLRPMIMPGSVGLTSVNGSTAGGRVSGTRFQLGLGDGTTWVLYASASVAFDWVAGSAGQLVAAAAFTGTLRVANAPSSPSIAALDAHAGVIPRGGSVVVATACDVARLQFNYTTTGTGSLLMTAMPHHMARLVSPVTAPLPYATLSGTLQGVEGSTWTMSLPLSPIGFSAPRAVASQYRSAVLAALASDASFVPDPTTVSNDSYFGGKLMARLARLALIADDLGETATAVTLRARLTPLVAAWLDRTNGNPFVYDDTWGGVVTIDALASPGALFGSGHYNDHHFHYGYFLYAAAALAKADPSFATAHRGALLGLVRDIANPSGSDPHFPRFRHMDFFRSHSWAAGLTDAPEGQDQESTSEAVNAWDGMHLLGVAWSDTRMAELGRVLQALETDGARTYWQIPSASTIYGAPFKNNMCVGILRATRAEFGTFFGGAGPEYVYGIQMIPYTPASENLISPIWVGDAWTKMSAAAVTASQGWKGFLYMAHGTTDRAAAWTQVNTLTDYDDGNSQTNTLWWVATRP